MEQFDNLSASDVAEAEGGNIRFHFTYDVETNVVTMQAEATLPSGSVMMDTVEGIAFYNDKGEIDAVLNIGGEGILLSEISEKGQIQNCGFFSNLFKAVVTAVVVAAVTVVVVATAGAAVPAVVAVAAATTAVAAVNLSGKITAASNLNNNNALPNPTGYIYDQFDYTSWRFGLNTLNNNGCGLVATFNVMKMLGRSQRLADIIYYYESTGGDVAFGLFGTDPDHIANYLSNKSIAYSTYYSQSSLSTAARNMTSSQKIILCFWYGLPLLSSAHIIAIEKSGNSFYGYNNRYSTPEFQTDLGQFYDSQNTFFMGYIVG